MLAIRGYVREERGGLTMLEMGRCGTPARYAGKDPQAGSVALKCHTSTTRGERIVRRRISYPPRLRIRELSALHRDLFLSD